MMAVDADQAWTIVTDAILNPSSSPFSTSPSLLDASITVLSDQSLIAPVLRDWFFETVRERIAARVAPHFWSSFAQALPSDVVSGVSERFRWLHAQVAPIAPALRRLEAIERRAAEGMCDHDVQAAGGVKREGVKPEEEGKSSAVKVTSQLGLRSKQVGIRQTRGRDDREGEQGSQGRGGARLRRGETSLAGGVSYHPEERGAGGGSGSFINLRGGRGESNSIVSNGSRAADRGGRGGQTGRGGGRLVNRAEAAVFPGGTNKTCTDYHDSRNSKKLPGLLTKAISENQPDGSESGGVTATPPNCDAPPAPNSTEFGINRLRLIYRGVIFYRTTRAFDDAMAAFFDRSIRAFEALSPSLGGGATPQGGVADDSTSSDGFESLTCAGCDRESDSCTCRETFARFGELVGRLSDLGVLERVTGEGVMRLLRGRIERRVDEKCRGNFDARYLESLRVWLGTGVVAWLDELLRAATACRVEESGYRLSGTDSKANPSATLPRNLSGGTEIKGQAGNFFNIFFGTNAINECISGWGHGASNLNLGGPCENARPSAEGGGAFGEWEGVKWDADKAAESGGGTQVAYRSHFERLFHLTCETYARARINQLFNIIVEFPESAPALHDLAECMEKVDVRATLVTSLRAALEARLLHPGVNTADILTAYISAIPALRLIDPSGVLLDLVSAPIRRYLRARDDTVRCIVSSLTEEGGAGGGGELSEELARGQPLMLDDGGAPGDDCAPPDADWRSWTPDPVDAVPSTRRGGSGGGPQTPGRGGGGGGGNNDIISTLVNIYGSKELFINEYRNILANRLLTRFSCADPEREVRYLELLKLRFGETQLHNCEVMLKDVADSRRINTNIAESRDYIRAAARRVARPPSPGAPPPPQPIDVSALILSAQFWPPRLREEKVELPLCFREALREYTRHYEMLKGNRTLSWKPHLGLVALEIELGGRTLTYNVSPVHATIIWHYQTRSSWTVEALADTMQMPTHALQRKLSFWQSQGLLREDSPDSFTLVDDHRALALAGGGASLGGGGVASSMEEESEEESALCSAHDQKEEELRLVWSYVTGMLTNLEALGIDRIHSMLRMFAMQGPGSQCSMGELRALLERRIKEQKLTYANGMYRLVKQ